MKIVFTFLSLLLPFHLLSFDQNQIDKLYECFPNKNIKINLEYDRIQWTPRDRPQSVCSFSFHLTHNGVYSIYLTRRWHSPAYCKKFINEWKLFENDDRKVCIAGYISYPEKKES